MTQFLNYICQDWWFPELVDPTETFESAAIREAKEEALIDVELKGIQRVENSLKPEQNHLIVRVIYYAEPIDQKQIPKQKPDRETQQTIWIDYNDLPSYSQIVPGWRGKELLQWSKYNQLIFIRLYILYIENGGVIMPLSFLSKEGTNPTIDKAFSKADLRLNKKL